MPTLSAELLTSGTKFSITGSAALVPMEPEVAETCCNQGPKNHTNVPLPLHQRECTTKKAEYNSLCSCKHCTNFTTEQYKFLNSGQKLCSPSRRLLHQKFPFDHVTLERTHFQGIRPAPSCETASFAEAKTEPPPVRVTILLL